MPTPDQRPQVEFYYALHEGPAVLIGAGSFDDLDKISKEADEINAGSEPKPTAIMSPGTEHIYKAFGDAAGVRPITDLALVHYTGLVEGSRAGYLKMLRDGDGPD